MQRVAEINPPPACNTGVEKKVSLRIDWIEVTFKPAEKRKLPSSLSQESKECYALHGYNSGLQFSDGRKEFVHTDRPDMGLHIQWDGGSLTQGAVDPLTLVQFLSTTEARFTRLDLAVDCYNFGLKPERATDEIRAKRFRCRCKKTPAWFDPTFGGWTQYLGTKASEIYCRIYDKAAEIGIKGDYTRVELVVRSTRAQKAAQAIVSGVDFRALVVGYVDFTAWQEWREVMAADVHTLQAEKKDSQPKLWLLKQCAPALARVMDEDGDDEFWFRFLDIVRENRQLH